MEELPGVGSYLHEAGGHQLAHLLHGVLGFVRLGQGGDVLRDAGRGMVGEVPPLAAGDDAFGVQLRLERPGLVQAGGHCFQCGPVGAAHQDAGFPEAGDLVGYLGEAGDEEVAHGDVGAGCAVQHLPQPGQQVRVGAGVEDGHGRSSSSISTVPPGRAMTVSLLSISRAIPSNGSLPISRTTTPRCRPCQDTTPS